MKKAWVLIYQLSAQQRLFIRLSGCPNAQADLSLRCAHSHFVGFVMRQLNFLLSHLFSHLSINIIISPVLFHYVNVSLYFRNHIMYLLKDINVRVPPNCPPSWLTFTFQNSDQHCHIATRNSCATNKYSRQHWWDIIILHQCWIEIYLVLCVFLEPFLSFTLFQQNFLSLIWDRPVCWRVCDQHHLVAVLLTGSLWTVLGWTELVLSCRVQLLLQPLSEI